MRRRRGSPLPRRQARGADDRLAVLRRGDRGTRPAGHVTSTEGSWQAGRDGAVAGIYMPARPTVGQSGRQEYLAGEADDPYRVLGLHATVSVPYKSSRDALLTEEWTPLEPGVLDHKLYVRGIGTVLEQTVRGGDERLEGDAPVSPGSRPRHRRSPEVVCGRTRDRVRRRLRRLRRGRSDVVLALPRQGRSIDVDLTPDGLFYGYDAPYTRQPGRLGFVPLDALRAGVSR